MEWGGGPTWRMPGESAARARADWTAHREAILEVWLDFWPGTRPWAWWRFDAVACRVRRVPAESWLAEAHREPRPTDALEYGEDGRTFEPSAEFLERHGLLTDAERASLAETPLPARIAAARRIFWSRDHLPAEPVLIGLGCPLADLSVLPPDERGRYVAFCRSLDVAPPEALEVVDVSTADDVAPTGEG